MPTSDAALAERAHAPLYRHWAARAVVVLLLSRLLPIAGFAWAQHRQHVAVSLSSMAQRWDGWWYVYLARHGYPSTLTIPGHPHYGPWGFFPTWPWTIRVLHDVTRLGYPMAALLGVTAYSIGFVIVVRIYAARLVGAAGADAAVLLLCVFPGALTFSLAYTEAGFLFWTVLALLWLDDGRFLPASAAVFMACATRSTGVALVLAAVVVAVRHRRDARALLPGGAGLLAFALMASFARARTGNALIWRDAEKQWNQRLDLGRGLWTAFTRTVPHRGVDHDAWTVMLAMFLLLLVLLALAAPRWRCVPPSTWAYLLVTAGSIFAYSNVGPRPRMVLALFPVIVLAAATLQARGRGWLAAAVAVSSAMTVVISFATMYPPWHVTA